MLPIGIGSRRATISFPEGEVEVAEVDDITVVLVPQKLLVERMNPEFWSPKWAPIYETLKNCPFRVQSLGDFIPEKVNRFGQDVPGITYGQVGERVYPPEGTKIIPQKGQVFLRLPNGAEKNGVVYLQVRNLKRTGIDIFESPPEKRYIVEGSRNDPLRSRLQPGDLLLIRSGVGSLGRCVVVPHNIGLANISQHIGRLVLNKIKPEWVALFLQCRYGAAQMERWLSGVSGQVEIDFDEIRALLIPVPDEETQNVIAREYWRMADYHYRAMEVRARGDDIAAREFLTIAIGMLETLLVQVEWLVEGKIETFLTLIPDGVSPRLVKFLEDEYRRIGELHQRLEQTRPSEDGDRAEPRLLGIPPQRYEPVVEEVKRLMHLIVSLGGEGFETR